jgi:hypothetical protein
VFFVSGVAGQVSRALTPPDAPAQIVTAGIRLPAQTFAKAPVTPVSAVRVALVPAHSAHRFTRAPRTRRAPAPVLSPPDVFAGLFDARDGGAERKVAIETSFARTEALQP